MKQFVPLECNPDVFNALAANFGVQGVEFVDIYSLDPEMLEFVPHPVLAVLLVFPISESYEKYRESIDSNVPDYNSFGDDEDAVWFRQTIGNACGTMAFLHATNALQSDQISGTMATILAETKDLDPEARAKYLESSQDFENIHSSVAVEGDTAVPGSEEDVDFHYVCLTRAKKSGKFVELDGRRKGPCYRGGPINDLLDPQVIDVIKEFIAREGDGQFSMIAMCSSS